jgi:hypothetical protein
MAGPIGFGIGAARAVQRVVCPHCGAVMARSRKLTGPIKCRTCKKTFDPTPPRRAAKKKKP